MSKRHRPQVHEDPADKGHRGQGEHRIAIKQAPHLEHRKTTEQKAKAVRPEDGRHRDAVADGQRLKIG